MNNFINIISRIFAQVIPHAFSSALLFIKEYLYIFLFLLGMIIGCLTTRVYYVSKDKSRLLNEANLNKVIQIDVIHDKIKSDIQSKTNFDKYLQKKKEILKEHVQVGGDCSSICNRVNDLIIKYE